MALATTVEVAFMLKDNVIAGQGMKGMIAIFVQQAISLLASSACGPTTASKATPYRHLHQEWVPANLTRIYFSITLDIQGKTGCNSMMSSKKEKGKKNPEGAFQKFTRRHQ